MKPNEIECLAKLRATNDVPGLLLLRQHKSELAFTFPLITSEVVLFRRVLENIVYFASDVQKKRWHLYINGN